QTAASVIRPAAFCGVFGYRPSFGEFSLSGIRPFAESMDTLGIFARSVDDIMLMRSVLSDPAIAAGKPSSHDAIRMPRIASPKIALCRTAQWSLADEYMQSALQNAAERLRERGANVSELELSDHFSALIDAQAAIMAHETARNYVFEMTHFADRV